MSTIFFLILFPLAVAFVLLAVRADALRDAIVKIAAAVIAAGSVSGSNKHVCRDSSFRFRM